MLDIKIVNCWMGDEAVEGVLFRLNDSVRIKSGSNKGRVGAVVSLVKLEPEPIFLVETSEGEDLLVHQSKLTSTMSEE